MHFAKSTARYFVETIRFVRPAAHSVVLVAALVVSTTAHGWADPLVVSKSSTPCEASSTVYKTIQTAVDAATSGAEIDVCPGTYPEQVRITIPLTLSGIHTGNADNPAVTVPVGGVIANATASPRGTPYSTAAQILVQNAAGVTVKNLAVHGSGSGLTDCNTGIVGIYYQNASGTVDNVSVGGQVGFSNCGRGLGIYVESDGAASSTVTIQNSVVRFTSGLNIGGTAAGTTVKIAGNSVVGSNISDDNGIYVAQGATGTVSGNTVMNFTIPSDTLGSNTDGLCGIQITNSSNVTISGNTVGNTNCAISATQGSSLKIVHNTLVSTVDNDGIFICGNGNLVQDNTIMGSRNAGIRLDNSAADFCGGVGNGNTITQNTINGACIGILVPAGTTGNAFSLNTYNNVGIIKSDSICP
ncbi:MAG TPA: NosD domain-containing protein [Bryobacteraceae bacterium]|jgi:hypothetical protein|nr:NosD domain-containing protein [Bryobacteraceae bacterium]